MANREFIGLVFVGVLVTWAGGKSTLNISYLEPGSVVEHNAPRSLGFKKNSFEIYCYAGKPKYIVNIFNTVSLQLDIENDDFTQYEGSDPDAVQSAFEDNRSIFSFNFFSSKKKLVKLNPFNQSCIGIESASSYRVQLNLLRVDFWKVILFSLGFFVFFSAPALAENAIFYYLTGILLGISASLLIVIYMISKLIPRKPMMYGAMIGGWTLSFYFGQMIFDNLRVILVTHQMYVFWYVFISGLVSFVVCYRMGPPKNKRSKNLIKWGLQLLALLMIFYSSHFQEATVGINILICLIYHFPRSFIAKGKTMWRRRFPPKRRLLTSEEFYEQGVHETTKALEELRQYCSSPEAKPWRTMLKLRDPGRFASFMEGNSHLEDEEILDYETSRDNLELDDDGSDISEDEDGENGENAEISEDEEVTPPAPGWAYDRFSRNLQSSRQTNGTRTPLRGGSERKTPLRSTPLRPTPTRSTRGTSLNNDSRRRK